MTKPDAMTDAELQKFCDAVEILVGDPQYWGRQDTSEAPRVARENLPAVRALLRAPEASPNPENEKRAAEFRAASRASSDGAPDGTLEGLATCMRMLDTYAAESFPANEHGQIHFARAMMESTADEIRAFLATLPPTPEGV